MGIFGGGSMPAPVVAPSKSDSDIQSEAERQRRLLAKQRGRQSTILGGYEDPKTTLGSPALLGG